MQFVLMFLERHIREVLKSFSFEFLGDLAGNAFCAPMMTIILMAFFTIYARKEQTALDASITGAFENESQSLSQTSWGQALDDTLDNHDLCDLLEEGLVDDLQALIDEES